MSLSNSSSTFQLSSFFNPPCPTSSNNSVPPFYDPYTNYPYYQPSSYYSNSFSTSSFDSVLKNQEKIIERLDHIISLCTPSTSSSVPNDTPAPPVPQPGPVERFTGSLDAPDDVLARHPKLRGDNKMGALAVALAKQSFFGIEIMCSSSVGGKGPNTKPLPEERLRAIKRIIFSLCPCYHNDIQKFELVIWNKCKTALNHSCNRLRSWDTLESSASTM